jgi:hypothetical protein
MRKLWQETRDPGCKTVVNRVWKAIRRVIRKKALGQWETKLANTTILKLSNEGKLTLKNECKGYSSYVTLYSTSMTTINVTSDYEPSATINLNDCFENIQNVPFENLPLHTPFSKCYGFH